MRIDIFDIKKHTDKKLVIYGEADLKYITTYCLNKAGIRAYCYAHKDGIFQSPYMNMSLCEISKIKDEIKVLLAVKRMNYEVINELHNAGIEEVYSARELWENTDFLAENHIKQYVEIYQNREEIFFYEDRVFYPDKTMLMTIDVMVTERCSLKCEACSNLMQYYQCPSHMNMEELADTLEILLSKIERVLALCILGGEPFMNPEFVRIVDRFVDHPKVGRVSIYSNATIFPNEDILVHLKHPKIVMSMSDYGSLSYNLDKWVDWCRYNNIRYIVKKMDVWQDCGKLERHDYTEYELKDIFSNCDCRDVPTIIGNKLFGCQYIANAANLGAMYESEMKKDYIVIDENTTGEEIGDFLYNREYWEGCKYCKGRNLKRANITPFVQTKTALAYERLIDVPYTHDEPKREKIDADKLISVIIPMYNVEAYIERCLKSIMAQTYSNLEIIVIDDGSTDASIDICKTCKESDKLGRIHLIKNQHSGVVVARNTGIELASGEYIIFVDADDYLDMDFLERLKRQIDDCDLIMGNFVEIIEGNLTDKYGVSQKGNYSIRRNDIPTAVYEGEMIKTIVSNSFHYSKVGYVLTNIWGKLYKTDIIKRMYRMVDTRLWYSEDTLFFLIYLSICKKIKIVDEYGYMYTVHDVEHRYPWKDYLENVNILIECYKKAFEGLPCEKQLIEAAEKDYVWRMHRAAQLYVNYNQRIAQYYYPYYGRLAGKRVILYGAGNVGKGYYSELKEDKTVIFLAWVDKNAEYLRDKKFLPVKGLEYLDGLLENDYDYIIIAVFDKPVYEKIRMELSARGISNDKIIWSPTRIE